MFIGERLVLLKTEAGQAASSTLGYFFAPAFYAILCVALGVSLRGGSLRYRRLATAVAVFLAVAVVLLKVRAALLGKLIPTTGTVLDDMSFAAAIVPLLAPAPSRGHIRCGYVFGCLWIVVEVVLLIR